MQKQHLDNVALLYPAIMFSSPETCFNNGGKVSKNTRIRPRVRVNFFMYSFFMSNPFKSELKSHDVIYLLIKHYSI